MQETGKEIPRFSKLKYPKIPKDIEIIDITKNKVNIKTIQGKEVHGKTWRQFKVFLGDIGLDPTNYHYTFAKKDGSQDVGLVKPIIKSKPADKNNNTGDSEILGLRKEIADIKRNQPGSNNIAQDFYFSQIEKTHQAEIRLYTFQIGLLEKEVEKKENIIKELEKECDELDTKVLELAESAKSNDYIKMIMPQIFSGGKNGKTSLADNVEGIPGNIVSILKTVDYSKIPAAKLSELEYGLTMIVQQLPKKQQVS